MRTEFLCVSILRVASGPRDHLIILLVPSQNEKSCTTVFDESLPSFGSLKMNILSNF